MLLSTRQYINLSGFLPRFLSGLRKTFGLLAVGLCFAPSLYADELDPKVYDLKSRHGVLAVYQRVQSIAEHHCVANGELVQALSAKQRTCRDRVLVELLGKIADPYLSYLHENPKAQRLAKR